MGLFSRKKAQPTTARPGGIRGSGGEIEDQKNHPGHRAVLQHLQEREQSEPGIRERVAGSIFYDFSCGLMKDERGVRIEDMIAMLASAPHQPRQVPGCRFAIADLYSPCFG